VILLAGAALTALIAALPAAHALRQTYRNASLRISDRGASRTKSVRWLAGTLVVGQVAFALLLSITATLLVRSFLNVLAQEPGFEPEHVIAARIDLPRLPDEALRWLPARIEARLAAIPGFDGCVVTSTPFLPVPGYPYGMGHSGTLSIHGHASGTDGPLPGVFYCGVSASYARVLGLRIVQGRWFDEADIASGRAVVVDETFVRLHFPGQDPLGRRIARGSPRAAPEEWPEIIGVAANVRHNGAEDRGNAPFTYFSRDHVGFAGSASVLIRTTRPPEEAFAILRRVVREVDPAIPVYAESTMRSVIDDSMRRRQGITLILTAFAGIALILSALGVFGMLAYDVSRRTRELGVRMALGATRTGVTAMVIGDGVAKALLGLGIGLGLAILANRPIAGLLFDVEAMDMHSYLLSTAVLLATTVAAAWLPARRAAQVDPMVALRCE
jgi:predicted permease